MSRVIQLRNVPDDLHRKLSSRAALAGLSLSEYLVNEIRRVAARPSHEAIVLTFPARVAGTRENAKRPRHSRR